MGTILSITLPIFALILAGYGCARRRLLDISATDALNRFVIYLALPALLFQATAHVHPAELNQPGFALALALGVLPPYLAAMWLTRTGRLADRTINGLNAGYANAGFMGIPLCLSTFGDAALPALVIATVMTACVLFAVSIVLIEIDLAAAGGLGQTLRKLARVLGTNPLLIAPIAGLAIALAGLPLPTAVDRFMGLLGAAASPCALVTIGLFLGQQQTPFDRAIVARLVALKLALQPAATYVLAAYVFEMPALFMKIVVIIAALPTGTGPFMLAKLHDRQSAPTSGTILVSTVLSVATVSLIMALLGVG